MPYLTINGVRTYYEDEGNGKEALVFGHSMLFNLRMFDQQVDYLNTGYRCIRYDFRGHGKSESPVGGYDLDTLTNDFLELVQALKCGPCHFVGFSMGGMVALRAALKSPESIKSLVLIDTSSEPEPGSGMLRNRAMLLVAKYIGLQPLTGQVMKLFFGKDFLQDARRKEMRNIWKHHFTSNDRAGIVKAVQGILYRKGITEQIGAIKHPTTIMVGEQDQLTDLNKAKILYENLPNSVLKVIPRAGHMLPVEEPDIVNTTIENHLRNYRFNQN